MIKKLFLLFLTSIKLQTAFGQNAVEKVASGTWFEETDFAGANVVFAKMDNKRLIAFRQINGSGLPVIETEVFTVEIQKDTIFILTPLKDQKATKSKKITYTYSHTQGLTRNKKPLKLLSDKPQIRLFTPENKLVGESVDVNKITRYDIENNLVYVGEKTFKLQPIKK